MSTPFGDFNVSREHLADLVAALLLAASDVSATLPSPNRRNHLRN
jgi:hypothetical protein